MCEPDVFIGNNRITINTATVMKILTDWLHVNVSGGPYKVTGWEVNSDLDGIEFDFQAVELKEKAKAKG